MNTPTKPNGGGSIALIVAVELATIAIVSALWLTWDMLVAAFFLHLAIILFDVPGVVRGLRALLGPGDDEGNPPGGSGAGGPGEKGVTRAASSPDS